MTPTSTPPPRQHGGVTDSKEETCWRRTTTRRSSSSIKRLMNASCPITAAAAVAVVWCALIMEEQTRKCYLRRKKWVQARLNVPVVNTREGDGSRCANYGSQERNPYARYVSSPSETGAAVRFQYDFSSTKFRGMRIYFRELLPSFCRQERVEERVRTNMWT